jgi:glutathione-regulated potassium-efflux system ancillary protein KefC
MFEIWSSAFLWLALAVIAALAAAKLRVNLALAEVVIGVLASLVFATCFDSELLSRDTPWVSFLAGAGAIMLTFLAGAELDPEIVRRRWKEALGLGLASSLLPTLVCVAAAHYLLGWSWSASVLAGVALSATSVAVVYTVMLETGLNRTTYGKVLLAACFITDLVTVVALGVIFAPFTAKTIVFLAATALVMVLLTKGAPRLLRRYGEGSAELEVRGLLICLLGLSALAVWSGNEPVLPAYLVGMVLAGSVGANQPLVRRLRTLTLGLLTPFYFLRAGSFVSVPALALGAGGFLLLLSSHIGAKFVGIFPVTRFFRAPAREGMFTTLLMATGLTFGTIAAFFGLRHGIINRDQYSLLVATIIGTAVIPTLLAYKFLPRHHLGAADAPSAPSPHDRPMALPVGAELARVELSSAPAPREPHHVAPTCA